MQHNAFCAGAAAHGPALRMDSSSRVLQFASYVSTFNLHMLFHGSPDLLTINKDFRCELARNSYDIDFRGCRMRAGRRVENESHHRCHQRDEHYMDFVDAIFYSDNSAIRGPDPASSRLGRRSNEPDSYLNMG